MPKPHASEVEVVYVSDAKALHAAVHKLRQQAFFKSRTIDTETTGCIPFLHRLKVIQIGVEGWPIFVIQIERIPKSEWGPLRQYLAEACPNVLQNAKFDLKMLAAEDLALAGEITDTIIRSKLFHLGKRKIEHNLKALAFRWCRLRIDKTQQTSFLADESRQPLSQAQLSYAATDITATTQVGAALAIALQSRQRKQPGILAHVEREERFLPLLAKLENQGVLVDPGAVEVLAAEIKATMEAIETQLAPVLQPHLKQLKLNLGQKPAFTPTKLLEEPVKAAFQLENAETKTLLRATQRHPLAKLVLQHEALWRQLDCSVGLLKKRNPATGKWHPDHAQIENLQGSLGPSKLKIELLKKLTESWRKEPLQLLQPANGHQFVKVSFPELELRLLAHYSREPLLQKELSNGTSPVESLAAAITTARLSVAGYQDSFIAQALWHGVGILNQKGLYLQSWLYSEQGIALDQKQVKALQALIPNRYPDLELFHAKVGKSNDEQRQTLLGALRLWHEASPKEVRNFLVWSSHNEILKECVSYVQTCCAETNSRVAFLGEQSLLLEVPLAKAEALTDAVLDELIAKLTRDFPQIAIAVEVSVISK